MGSQSHGLMLTLVDCRKWQLTSLADGNITLAERKWLLISLAQGDIAPAEVRLQLTSLARGIFGSLHSSSGRSLHLLVATSLLPFRGGSSPHVWWRHRFCENGSGSSLHLLVATSLLQRCSDSSLHLLRATSRLQRCSGNFAFA